MKPLPLTERAKRRTTDLIEYAGYKIVRETSRMMWFITWDDVPKGRQSVRFTHSDACIRSIEWERERLWIWIHRRELCESP